MEILIKWIYYQKKQLAFVHFASIQSAMKAVEEIQKLEKYKSRRVAFGRDRSTTDRKNVGVTQSSSNDGSYSSGGGLTNRTVYLGNIDPDTTQRELFDKIRGGMVESVKILPEKKCAFVHFVEPAAALFFHQLCSNEPLFIHGQEVKAGWGKSYPLRSKIAAAVSRGATRNVFIGQVDESTNEDELRDEFKQYGEIDKIDVPPKKSIAFVHFASIQAATQAVDALKKTEKYKGKRIGFGRDRSAGR